MAWIVAFAMTSSLANAGTISLVTNLAPPYQVQQADGISGTSVATLLCIFEQLELNSDITILPWKRALKHLEKGLSDGLFSASYDPNVNRFATLSAPIAIEKWYFFFASHEPQPPTENTPIGVILGSNQDKWLSQLGYHKLQRVGSYPQLIKLAMSKRVDAVAADAQAFTQALVSHFDTQPKFSKTFIKYAPLGVYFNNGFIDKEQHFLTNFNAQTPTCTNDTITLAQDELTALKSIVLEHLNSWIKAPVVIDTVKQQNARNSYLSLSQVNALEQQWQRKRPSLEAHGQLLKTNLLSEYFQQVKRQSGGLYNEIIAMDRNGLVIAMSDLTTDLWQGDEDKFTQTFNAGPDALFIDHLRYDESTHKFQVQFSITLSDENQTAIGALTVGVDVEYALASSQVIASLN
ncbi:transporter substrate-binding domain-containing protein [Neiella sp. HB171785]|uniref:Transporter substrate-binding domain-containing protein n=1 Tax=Neiella litorisoli TaxID=2771431 RepID=A0A8J6QI46_9GAMM|nr:transporter substrate-binding domain-containing protein [Neiella litorisoli]MBD1388988.1 transporter substrate-binding domain-containing protein [Neiella litorisoli]